MWRSLKPWISVIALLLVLHYSGALAGLSSLSKSAILETGALDADPSFSDGEKELLDFNFAVKTLEGETVDFNSFKGKTIFLNIWATWCGPCRAEMPSIQKLYNKVSHDSIAFVMLSIDPVDQPGKVDKYIRNQKYTFPVFIAGELPVQLQVSVIPTTFVISPEGAIVYKKTGMAQYDTNKFRKFLERLSDEED